MKFDWQYRYVDGGNKPDKHGRWALDLFVLVKVGKNLPDYKKLNGIYGKYMPIKIAVIKLTKKDNHGKFCSNIYSIDSGDTYSLVEKTIYSDNLNELKKIIETEYINTKNFFKNLR